jgi:hypothetical protein
MRRDDDDESPTEILTADCGVFGGTIGVVGTPLVESTSDSDRLVEGETSTS